MRELLAIVIGYLLGSVLPADLLARAQGVDIRAVGTKNPGSTNALQQLGPIPGIITTLYDVSVGLIAMYVASLLGVSTGWIYAAGVAAIVGHVFPIYFGFHGGEGMAATTGILVYEMGVALDEGWLTLTGVGLLVVIALVVFALTRSASMVGVIVAPLLAIEIVLGRPDPIFAVFMVGLAAFIWAIQLRRVRRDDLWHLSGPTRSRVTRLKASHR